MDYKHQLQLKVSQNGLLERVKKNANLNLKKRA